MTAPKKPAPALQAGAERPEPAPALTPATVRFPKGRTIFREGAERNVAYLIQEGAVTVSRAVNGREVVLARLGQGDILGEMALINKDRRTASARASEHCTLAILDEALLDRLLDQSHQLIRRITRQLAARLRDADRRIQGGTSRCAFMAVARMLHTLDSLARLKAPAPSRSGQAPEAWVDYAELCRAIKDVAQLTQAEIDAVLGKLAGLGLVQTSEEKGVRRSKAFTRTLVRLPRPEEFLETATAVPQEIRLPEQLLEMEYMDLRDFAALVRTDPETVYARMARREMPEDILFLHRERALEWVERSGTQAFAARPRRKTPEELTGVDDVVDVDNATLEEVFRRLGYFRTQVLHALASDQAREKILKVVTKKAAQAIQEDGLDASDLTPEQAEEVQEDLVEAIRVAKRLEKKEA